MRRINPIALIAIVMGGFLVISNIGGFFSGGSNNSGSSNGNSARTLTILSGSENKALEPVVTRFCSRKRWTCVMEYRGSVDIMLALREGERGFDAVWPAHSHWIDLGDDERRVKHAASIIQSPVILGVQPDEIRRLGWDPENVSMSDITNAVDREAFGFLMTSATQSNSGFSAYISMLTSASGQDVLTASHLEGATLRENVKTILSGVERSAGSSGWLADLYVSRAEQGRVFPAMWNYEAILIETNQELERQRKTPLTFIYPTDGVSVADSPLGYINNTAENADRREALFLELQEHLLSDRVQQDLTDLGRRTAFGARVPNPKRDVWKASWGIDLNRSLAAIEFPAPAVTQTALGLYQTALRKPSAIAFCLDYSGSMQELNGERDMERAFLSLFNPRTTERYLLEATDDDQFLILTFNDKVRGVTRARGGTQGYDVAISTARGNNPGGGTNIYACASQAIAELQNLGAIEDFSAGVILMTDGESEDQFNAFRRFYQRNGFNIPVYGITFGSANETQLNDLAQLTDARVFDGTTDLTRAFRQARGYN